MALHESADSEVVLRPEMTIESLQQDARALARSVEMARQETLAHSNETIDSLERKARDLARFVETTRRQTLSQSEKKAEALEVKARELANFEEVLRNQTRLQSETEIEALGQRARELAGAVEAVRNETRRQSEADIACLERQARELAVSMATTRDRTFLQSDTEIKGLKQQKQVLILSQAELEESVQRRTKELEAANQELESFSYSVSHDLRSPLRCIQGFSRILLEEHAAELSPEVQEYLHDINRNAVRMGHLIDDLLAFSRLSRQELTTREVSPVQIVNLALEELLTERQDRNVEVVVGDLPTCQADPALLKQVWINLLANALKYSWKRDAARIEVGSRLQGEECVYFVRDNGVGFDMKYAGKLFGVFQRMHATTDYEGTGVGLAIVQRIVHRHGGRIWAEAALGEGATFSFTIPRPTISPRDSTF